MPMGQAIRQRQQDKSQEKARSRSTAKAKTDTVFPRRNGVRRSAEIAAFLLLSNNKDPSLKKNFKGGSENIFVLTLLIKTSRRPHARFARRLFDEPIQI